MVREVADPLLGMQVLHPGVVPHVPEAPGEVRWAGPGIGQHNAEVFGELLGMSAGDVAALVAEGVI
jgi:crotonobetainyl-CoA:carnitine CoA-transferase CaiB-like acyl-CoA transferase